MSQIKFGSVQWEDLVQVGPVSLTTDVSGVLPVANGGSGSGSFTDGQLLIGNTTGNTLAKATLTNVANQTVITNGGGSITIGTAQDIASGSSPTFAGLTLSAFTSGSVVFAGSSGVLSQNNSKFFWDNTNNRLGIGTTSPTTDLNIVHNYDGVTNFQVENTTDGTSSVVRGQLLSVNGGLVSFAAAPSYTGITEFANKAGFYTTVSTPSITGIAIASRTAAGVIEFYTGGSAAANKRLTLSSSGNFLWATTTTPTNATFNLVLGGGTTTPVLGAATADIVSIAAVDAAGGDRRLYIQSESGSPISIGNDKLNYAASTGGIQVGGTNVIAMTSSLVTFTQAFSVAKNQNSGLECTISNGDTGTSAYAGYIVQANGIRGSLIAFGATYVGGAQYQSNVMLYTQSAQALMFGINSAEVARFSGTGQNFQLGVVTTPTSATYNVVLGGGPTSPVTGAATADAVNICGFDRVNTRHAAAGNRVEAIQGERGSTIYVGDDAIDFAATTAYVSVNATDLLTLTSTSATLADAANLVVGSTTGTKIATATTQKLGFYNATPIVQRSGASQAAVATTASTQTTPWGYSTQAQADAIITLLNELRAWAVAQGFIKGSA